MSTTEEARLLELFAVLAPAERDSLLAFAEFLQTRRLSPGAPVTTAIPPKKKVERPKPLDIPRPEKEAVVAALKRLTATYPMLDKSKLLTDTSGLVTQHIMQGRPHVEVIDELEVIFTRHYQLWLDESGQD
jgi:hypothetical protein